MPAPLPHPEELQPVRGYRRPARTHGNQRITTLAASLIARSCSYARESAAGSHRGAPRPDVQPAHGNRWLTAAETQRLDRSDPYARESMRHRLMLAPDDVARPVRPGISGSGSPARCRPARTRGNRRRMDSRGIPRAASGPYARESAGKRRGPPLPNDVRPRTRGNQRDAADEALPLAASSPYARESAVHRRRARDDPAVQPVRAGISGENLRPVQVRGAQPVHAGIDGRCAHKRGVSPRRPIRAGIDGGWAAGWPRSCCPTRARGNQRMATARCWPSHMVQPVRAGISGTPGSTPWTRLGPARARGNQREGHGAIGALRDGPYARESTSALETRDQRREGPARTRENQRWVCSPDRALFESGTRTRGNQRDGIKLPEAPYLSTRTSGNQRPHRTGQRHGGHHQALKTVGVATP